MLVDPSVHWSCTDVLLTSNWYCPTKVRYQECSSSLNEPVVKSYSQSGGGSTTVTFREVYATPVQIRFQVSDSTVVPIPRDSLNLPFHKDDSAKEGLNRAVKFGIGFGVGIPVCALNMLHLLLQVC